MYYVYFLKSLKNNSRYIGSTSDLKERVKRHNAGFGGRYSSINKPFKLVYYEAYLDKRDALAAEKFYKTGFGREAIKSRLKFSVEK
ncbi:MAG: GIY-YIG nuclease family protein [Candidatus Paceibacterota bacterium]|jgi:putative endonuclease